MADKIIITYNQTDWDVQARVRGARSRDIPLGVIESTSNPDLPPKNIPQKNKRALVRYTKSLDSFYIKLNAGNYGEWYEIPNTKNIFQIRIDFGITLWREITDLGPPKKWTKWKPVILSSEPTSSNILEGPEVWDENPRWVKIGTKWYYIG